MAKIYIKDTNDKYHEVDVGRSSNVSLIVDWGGCTGEIIGIDMEKLWNDDSHSFSIVHDSCYTQDIGGIIINGEKLEVE